MDITIDKKKLVNIAAELDTALNFLNKISDLLQDSEDCENVYNTGFSAYHSVSQAKKAIEEIIMNH